VERCVRERETENERKRERERERERVGVGSWLDRKDVSSHSIHLNQFRCSVLQSVAVCGSVLRCVAVCCSVLQCAAVRCVARHGIHINE